MQTHQKGCTICNLDSNTSNVGPQESGNKRHYDLPRVIIFTINSPQTIARPGGIDLLQGKHMFHTKSRTTML